jgi:hypothetical protein
MTLRGRIILRQVFEVIESVAYKCEFDKSFEPPINICLNFGAHPKIESARSRKGNGRRQIGRAGYAKATLLHLSAALMHVHHRARCEMVLCFALSRCFSGPAAMAAIWAPTI